MHSDVVFHIGPVGSYTRELHVWQCVYSEVGYQRGTVCSAQYDQVHQAHADESKRTTSLLAELDYWQISMHDPQDMRRTNCFIDFL